MIAGTLLASIYEQNSVRIATEIFITAGVIVIVAYRIYRVRKTRSNQEFFDHRRDQRP